jgi:predicted house-cleaning noncanonical NTP pyrophosphatase (MazG superfamily)
MSDAREWRSPQLVRDNKPYRPGFPEAVTKVGRNEAIALLIAKLHSELYEIEMEPESAEEIADFLTVLQSLFEILSPAWTTDACGRHPQAGHGTATMLFASFCADLPRSELPVGGCGYGTIHHRIERFARNLLERDEVDAIILTLAYAACENNISCGEVVRQYERKWMKVGGFDGHLLWQSTEF